MIQLSKLETFPEDQDDEHQGANKLAGDFFNWHSHTEKFVLICSLR